MGNDGLSVRKAPIHGPFQIAQPPVLRHRLLEVSHYMTIVGRSGRHQMYNSLTIIFCWPHFSLVLRISYKAAQAVIGIIRGSDYRHSMQIFPASKRLEPTVMDSVGPISISNLGGQYIYFSTIYYSKYQWQSWHKNPKALHIAISFINY